MAPATGSSTTTCAPSADLRVRCDGVSEADYRTGLFLDEDPVAFVPVDASRQNFPRFGGCHPGANSMLGGATVETTRSPRLGVPLIEIVSAMLNWSCTTATRTLPSSASMLPRLSPVSGSISSSPFETTRSSSPAATTPRPRLTHTRLPSARNAARRGIRSDLLHQFVDALVRARDDRLPDGRPGVAREETAEAATTGDHEPAERQSPLADDRLDCLVYTTSLVFDQAEVHAHPPLAGLDADGADHRRQAIGY